MKDMNMDFGILTETKITNNLYATEADGYSITCTTVDSTHQGGVALFHRPSDLFVMEGTEAFGPNVIRATLVAGNKRWTVIGVYIPCSETDGATLAFLDKAMSTAPVDLEMIMLGDLNTDLTQTNFYRGQERQFATQNAVAGLTDLFYCFRQWKSDRGENNEYTWRQFRSGGWITSRVDYLLSTCKEDF